MLHFIRPTPRKPTVFMVAFVFYETNFNPLNAIFTKWSNTLKQFVGKLPTNSLSVFGHFVGLAFKGKIIKK